MSLITITFDEINLQQIQELIEHQVPESRHLEYKSQLPGNSDSEKKEFLADITAMANSGGGDIIYGIEEKTETDEKTYRIKPIPVPDVDEVKQRLESLLRNGIQPRLINCQLKEVKVENDSFLLILRIPRTLHTPYMVSLGGRQNFYARNSSGKHPMDINEIRTSFLAGSTYIEKAKKWCEDRLTAIKNNETFLPLEKGAKLVLHTIPLHYEYLEQVVSIKQYQEEVESVYSGYVAEFNLEGLITNAVYKYLQVFRTGQIENVDDCYLNVDKFGGICKTGESKVINCSYERVVVSFLNKNIALFKKVNITPPILIGLALFEVKGFKLYKGEVFLSAVKHQEIVDNDIILPGIILNDFNDDIPKLLKPVFDMVWNACGLPGSENYDNDGNWIG